MKIVIIDDERFALELLVMNLQEIEQNHIVGKFLNPLESLESMEHLQPEVAFISIELPEMNGIDLAQRIRKILPEIHLVFISENNEYAMNAFRLNAVDYLTKPIHKEVLKEVFNRITIRNNGQKSLHTKDPKVCCFQSLRFMKGEEIYSIKWRTTISKNLFAYLLHHRGTNVSKDKLINLFWPQLDIKHASAQLYSTIYHIRKLIQDIDFPIKISSSEFGYTLELGNVKVDVDEWEEKLSLVEEKITIETYPLVKKLFCQYKGPYFGDENYYWAEAEQQRLKMYWLKTAEKMVEYLIDQNEYKEAIIIYLHVQSIDPLLESTYFKLMKLFSMIEDRVSVKEQFERLCKMLSLEFGITPNEKVVQWYSDWEEKIKVHIRTGS